MYFACYWVCDYFVWIEEIMLLFVYGFLIDLSLDDHTHDDNHTEMQI